MSQSTVSPISREEFDFQLFDVLDVMQLTSRELHKEHDKETISAALDLAERIALDSFLPGYRKADLQEPRIENGKVVLIPEIAEAIAAFTDAGFMAAHLSFDEGGQQMPWSILQSCYSMFQASNIGATIYYFLTVSAANVLHEYGTEEQQRLYMRPLLQGQFLATMCLSEPEAGSSLADLRTKAILKEDGTYRIEGTKMWISGGEHELSENIIHLVLARIEGAPKGARGISLFIVPKLRVKPDGTIGEDNNIGLVGLNHKMGYRAATNAMLNFGEDGESIGILVGEANCGLVPMFLMMNEARISVGAGATMLGYAGYRYSLTYAKERRQGRAIDKKGPEHPPVPLIEHADVRRMLLTQKSFTEGALALCLFAAYLVDEERTAPETGDRKNAARLLAILTPIVKSWPSEFCLEANKLAIQVLGGYGYTIDYPVEQYYRDNRLNLIHEGTNGIQALDLVSRKLSAEEGACWTALVKKIREDVNLAAKHPELLEETQKLEEMLKRAEEVVALLCSRTSDPAMQTANASLFQDALGHICIGWMWLRQAHVARTALTEGSGTATKSFYQGKLTAAHFFFRYELGRVDHWLDVVGSFDDTLLELDPSCL